MAAGQLTEDEANKILRIIEEERNLQRLTNTDLAEEPTAASSAVNGRLNEAQLASLLAEREANMRAGLAGDGVTDQFRVYRDIVSAIAEGRYLRMMIQASAGTGKSYLLTSVYLWCIVHGYKVMACAPTGIAAANIEQEQTDIGATTLHNAFQLGGDMKTTLDLSSMNHRKVDALHKMNVLMIDEVSMIDIDLFHSIVEILSCIDHNKRPDVMCDDPFGDIHIILFGDFK
jgi:RecG-like helicase